MATETILQHWVLRQFAYPFLLIFFIMFAILEKTKILGTDKKQINALVSFVIGLIFVSVIYPKVVVENLILFLVVALVVFFVGLLLWGFATGGEARIGGKGIKIVFGVLIVVAVLIALIWAMGIWDEFYDVLFKQSWSSSLWTNVAFIVVVAAALAVLLGVKSKSP